MATEYRNFDSIEQITAEDIAWLKAGSYVSRGYIYNPRSVNYRTKRGVAKNMTCYVNSVGRVKWRSYTLNGTPKDGLTKEEMRYFEPEKYAEKQEQARERKMLAKAKAEKNAADNPVKVGDIFKGSYGYEACIYDYFEVVAVSKTGKSVTVRELAQERNSTGWCDWESRAISGRYVGKPMRKNLNFDGNTPNFKVSSYEWAYRTDNPEEWDSGYNYH